MCNPSKLLKIWSMFKKSWFTSLWEFFFQILENGWLRTKKLIFGNFKFTFWQSILAKQTLTVTIVRKRKNMFLIKLIRQSLIQSRFAVVWNAPFHHQDHLDFVKHLNYLLDDFWYHMTEFKCLKTVFMFNFLEVNNEGMWS